MDPEQLESLHQQASGLYLEGNFTGALEAWQQVLAQQPDDERETLVAVVDSVDSLLEGRAEDFRAWDAAGEMPAEFVQELREFGLFSLIVPEEQGGMGFGSMAYSRTVQQVARQAFCLRGAIFKIDLAGRDQRSPARLGCDGSADQCQTSQRCCRTQGAADTPH